jgi:hypothetical protein
VLCDYVAAANTIRVRQTHPSASWPIRVLRDSDDFMILYILFSITLCPVVLVVKHRSGTKYVRRKDYIVGLTSSPAVQTTVMAFMSFYIYDEILSPVPLSRRHHRLLICGYKTMWYCNTAEWGRTIYIYIYTYTTYNKVRLYNVELTSALRRRGDV